MSNQKGASYIFILLGIVFLLIITYVIYNKVSLNVLKIVEEENIINPQPSPEMIWKTYINNQYSYSVDYSSTAEYVENKTLAYDYINFLAGCFKVYSGQKGFNTKVPYINDGVPWKELDMLKSLGEGERLTLPNDTREKREDGSYIIKYTYVRLPSKSIAGQEWVTFEESNNWENHGTKNIYFIDKQDKFYLIDMLSYGPCYEEEPLKMLTSFKFIN